MKSKKSLSIIFSVVMIIAMFSSAFAATPEDEAKKLVYKAYDFYKKNGKDALMNEIKNPNGQFINGELYVFLWL